MSTVAPIGIQSGFHPGAQPGVQPGSQEGADAPSASHRAHPGAHRRPGPVRITRTTTGGRRVARPTADTTLVGAIPLLSRRRMAHLIANW